MPQPQRIALLTLAVLALTTTSGVPLPLSPLEPATLSRMHLRLRPELVLSQLVPLPPAASGLRAPVAEPPRWQRLMQAADGGDPRAACELSLLLEDCRIASTIGDMVETQVTMAAYSGANPVIAAAEIAALEASAEAFGPQCASLPDALLERGWSYLLAAAIAGHDASIHRFLTDPPVRAEAGEEYRQARQRYRENASLLLGDLLQRHSPGAFALAFRAAQGEVFFDDLTLQPPDPAAVVRFGTALLSVREDGNREAAIDRALEQLSTRDAERARAEGRALAWHLLPIPTAAPVAGLPAIDECAEGWPGSRSHYTAYSF